ncbi:Golgi to ER traffic protein 4-like [Tropilaelaps mercedesae]|uniref:Golgi to ER traffic protein 4-like n=1 Tax=Tropilaelaps mercedesae TaxID=418985 RepID=A0A1V9Y2Q2_9ACAR|nr:Golgi to ER traffic protein 4-like [Tropilaelaps mercedesae]
MAARGEQGLERVRVKLEQCLKDRDFYHAHQMYRTLYFRLNRQLKWSQCADIMFEGSDKLLVNGELNSGADLAALFVEALNKGHIPADGHVLGRLAKLHSMMKAHSPERLTFTVKCIEYSSVWVPSTCKTGAGVPSCKRVTLNKNDESLSDVSSASSSISTVCRKDSSFGHPDLHRLLALNFWREKNFSDARYHFIHSTDGTNCARMLVEFHTSRGYRSEVDLFIAQAVLQFLCLRNQQTATVAFLVYTRGHPAVQGPPPFTLPLLNFLWFLLLAVESRAKLAIFTLLCDKYRTSLDRDPTYRLYLEKIGQIFFGQQPSHGREQGGMFGGGFFGNMINQLMAGLGDDIEDDEEFNISTEDVD